MAELIHCLWRIVVTDRDFLIWLHERLVRAYNENSNYDYMHKLRSIIEATPKDRVTLNCCSKDIDQLKYDYTLCEDCGTKYNGLHNCCGNSKVTIGVIWP